MENRTDNKPIWHTISITALHENLGVGRSGLTQSEALLRLKEIGLNELPKKAATTRWKVLGRQFASPLIYILGIAAAVSLAINETTDAAFIAAVLLINASIGFFQEWRAEKSVQALQRYLQMKATVVREGMVREIDARHVVPGDIVLLESGNRVPADIRLLHVYGLEIDESLLTGESLPVQKRLAVLPESTPIAERQNMALAGTVVVRGRAKGIVVETGSRTAIGGLALDVSRTVGGKPPLILRLEKFSHAVAWVALISVLVLVCIGIFLRGYDTVEMFVFGVALAVSAIPEGLPVALTIALAIGMNRMAKRGVIVRRLSAVEALGSCTHIASDKTGTLTCNELTVREIQISSGQFFSVTGEGFCDEGEVLCDGKRVKKGQFPELQELNVCATLCNEAELYSVGEHFEWRGDPTEVALLSMAMKFGFERESLFDKYPIVNLIPFEPEHRFAASFHRHQGSIRVFAKGTAEKIFAMCRFENRERELRILQFSLNQMAKRGLRVLAFASGNVEGSLDASAVPEEPKNLEFLGIVGMIDPLRPNTLEVIKKCQSAGISVSMITGDHPQTALSIAKELGITDEAGTVVTGSELEGKSPDEIKKMVQQSKIFARIGPHQKYQLVNALRDVGHFVAVTGDGVNDAPALRLANVGVAMGKAGTDVAREAAELVISDDNFATIVAGVEEGRIAYDNIRKVINLLISTGAAEVILVSLAVLMGMPLPLLPVQLLWLNLVTNGVQHVALAFEPGEGDVLHRRPRSPKEPIFNRLMIERVVVSAIVMGLVATVVFWWLLKAGFSEHAARNALLFLMVLFENIHLGNCRSETKSALKLSPLKSPLLLASAILALLLHLSMMYLPFGREILDTEPIPFTTAAWLFLCALSVFVAVEIHKWIWSRSRTNRAKTEPGGSP